MTATDYPITCDGLSKKYRGADALEGLHLRVPAGSIYGLVGPNGAGKTTAIQTMMNIVRPTRGAARILGTDSRRLGPDDFARIGYVSENQQMPDWMTVGYFMNYLKPFYPTWDDALANEMLRGFDLPLNRNLSQVSRGMRMKASLASSLAYRPKLLILDEPFSGLDPAVRDEFIEGMLESAAGGDTTIFISSHDLAEIESFASHVGYLERGRLQFSEEMSSLTARFREVVVTLEAPLTELPRQLPATWLRPQLAASTVRFAASDFDEERTPAEIRQFFAAARDISAAPMALREIFVALARRNAK